LGSGALAYSGAAAMAAGGAAAAAAGGMALGGCAKQDATTVLLAAAQRDCPDAKVVMLEMGEDQVVAGTGFEQVDVEGYFEQKASYDLPLCSMLHQATNRSVLVLAPGELARIPVTMRLLNLETGVLSMLLDSAIEDADDYVIYDARCNDSAAIWVECRMTSGDWKVYGATLSVFGLGAPTLLDQGDSEWEPPQLAVSGANVYWTRMPDPTGPQRYSDSLFKAATVNAREGGSGVRTIHTSHGRMITAPQVIGSSIAIVPRVDTESVVYQLTAIDVASEKATDVAILPAGMRVSDCQHINGEFVFSVEANYDYAGGIGYYGTYRMLGADKVFYSNKPPTVPTLFCKECMLVKSTRSIVGFDIAAERSFFFDRPEGSADFGDLLAGSGRQDRVVAYTTITGEQKVVVRVYEHV
jgi:hypothetical protein